MTLTGLVFLALPLSPDATAADRWIEKRNPDELFAYVDSHDCPVTTAELTDAVHARLIRSRIRPLTRWQSDDIALYVVLDCRAAGSDQWAYRLEVMLARLRQDRREQVAISFRHEDQFGSFGTAGPDHLRQLVDAAVEMAFDKYLKANFDLDPGEP